MNARAAAEMAQQKVHPRRAPERPGTPDAQRAASPSLSESFVRTLPYRSHAGPGIGLQTGQHDDPAAAQTSAEGSSVARRRCIKPPGMRDAQHRSPNRAPRKELEAEASAAALRAAASHARQCRQREHRTDARFRAAAPAHQALACNCPQRGAFLEIWDVFRSHICLMASCRCICGVYVSHESRRGHI